MKDRFQILVRERLDSSSGDPPRVPPGTDPEDLDLCLSRFCYEQNRGVVIQVGADELESELDADFSRMLIRMPEMVARLSAGQPESLSFSEIGYTIEFVPQDNFVQCTVSFWGYNRAAERSFLCDRAQVIDQLWLFLAWIADGAIAGGYLSPARREEFLGQGPAHPR